MRARTLAAALGALVLTIIVLSPAAEGVVLNGFFNDDDGNTFESDIDAIANAGITKGCNPRRTPTSARTLWSTEGRWQPS